MSTCRPVHLYGLTNPRGVEGCNGDGTTGVLSRERGNLITISITLY